MLDRPEPDDPWTVAELATHLDCSASTVYNRLRELHSLEKIDTRKNGQIRYWWPVTDPKIPA
jgi:predicted transcriptional regulator